MKTRFLFAMLPVFCAIQVFAQGSGANCNTLQSINNLNGPIYHRHNTALSEHLMRTSAATGSRVTGETDLSNNGATFVYSDSIILHYSGTRGGDLNHLGLQLKYDNATEYTYNTTSSAWQNYMYEFQTFDASNNILSTVEQTWNASASAWVNAYENLYTYVGNNAQTAVYQSWDTVGSAWVNMDKDIYTYDGSGNVLTDVYQYWNSSTSVWVNSSQSTYTYNSNNKVTSIISQSWDTTAHVWNNESKVVYTYDISNTYVMTESDQGWNSGTSTWDAVDQHVYTYDGSNDLVTDLYQEWATSVWLNYSLNSYGNFVAQMPQTQIYQAWNTTSLAFDNQSKYTNTYNGYNQLTEQVSQTWNIGGFWQSTTGDRDSRFYYEDYATGVKTVGVGGNANIYPVPAKDDINIDINWNEPQPFSVRIFNLFGAEVNRLDVPACAQYQASIKLDLVPGSYFMKIEGLNGSINKQFVVMR